MAVDLMPRKIFSFYELDFSSVFHKSIPCTLVISTVVLINEIVIYNEIIKFGVAT